MGTSFFVNLVAQADSTSSEGSNAFLGFVCFGVICLICYLAGKGKRARGFDEVSFRRVRPKR